MRTWHKLTWSRLTSLAPCLLGVTLAGVLAFGCAPKSPNRDSAATETQTSGVITVAADPEVAGLVRAMARAFEATYPDASIRVVARDSHDAMNDVFGARADLAVIGREIEPIERQTATEARIDMEAYHWAWEGVAVVVHPGNPVNQLSLDDLRRILTSGSASWADFGGSTRRVVPVLESPRRSLTQFVAHAIVEAGDSLTAAVLVDDDSSVVSAVARTPDALGFVAQSSLRPGVKVLGLSRATGMPYVEPDAETVYHHDYPLTRTYNLVTRTPGRPLGQGLLTFALSEAGQKLVQDAHLVPASVPVRFTHRLPTVASHGPAAHAAAEEGDRNR